MSICKLKSTTETVIKVHSNDLDKFIQEITGQKDYECVAAQEWENDSQHTFTVNFTVDGKIDDFYGKTDWDKFKEGKISGEFMLGTILNGLCADKHIPPGKYLIIVSW